jgi:hypothetical protein
MVFFPYVLKWWKSYLVIGKNKVKLKKPLNERLLGIKLCIFSKIFLFNC